MTRDQLIHGPSSMNRRLICPEHRQPLKYKFAYCKKCGVKIEYRTPQSKIPLLCLDCDPVRKRKKEYQERQKRKARITASDEELIEIMMERAECLYRPLCFEVYIKKNRLPCFECVEFKKKSSLSFLLYNIDLKELDSLIKKLHQAEDPNTQKQLYGQGQEKWGPLFEKREHDLK